MNSFFIIANSDKGSVFCTAREIEDCLKKRGKKCSLVYGYVDKRAVPKDVECVIVLGGDGTMLQASRELLGIHAAFIGVNFGNLGFLAEVEKEGVGEMLERLIEGRFKIEPRMMLMGQVIRDGRIIAEDVALNDIVISRSGSLKVMDFTVYVNDLRLKSYKADGVIVATPTGSTAYSMSAGGPIVNPAASLMTLTPICPHTLNTRSIVLEGDDIIEIYVNQRANSPNESKGVYFDGDRCAELISGDKVLVRKSALSTNIIKLSSKSFLEVLGRKMGSNEDGQT